MAMYLKEYFSNTLRSVVWLLSLSVAQVPRAFQLSEGQILSTHLEPIKGGESTLEQLHIHLARQNHHLRDKSHTKIIKGRI